MKTNLIKKIELRKKQHILRKQLFKTTKHVFNKDLFDELFKKNNFENTKIVSSFISINSEINTYELNNYITSKNKILCLPAILKKDDHLIFRKFTNNNDLIEGLMQTKEPRNTNQILVPDLLFVPCLAFDMNGFRLGYGGGYYDKTFSYLMNNNNIFTSVGYAFDDQKVNKVPKDNFDIKLDYVITEKQIYSFL